ncbi:MAG: hypothetical protein JST22_06410 [Bacteroidetes bacterium]|nr:hypothetical protein [Bacteroidota bacterium]
MAAYTALAACTPAAAQTTASRPEARDTSAAVRRDAAVTPAPAAPTRPWYDTLTVTKARYAGTTPGERLALAAFTAMTIPVGLTIGITTLLPPSVNILREDGVSRMGIAFSTGVGLVGDTTAITFFPWVRLQGEGGFYFGRTDHTILRASLLRDLPIAQLDRRGFFWLGTAAGLGAGTDFNGFAPYAEGWVGLLNPMGIRYLTLFPMHNYGLRGRFGYNTATGRPWYELSICATSTFWF